MIYKAINKLRRTRKKTYKSKVIAELFYSPTSKEKTQSIRSQPETIVPNKSFEDKRLAGKTIIILLWCRSYVGGGLTENIYDTIKFIKKSGGKPIIVCAKSDFAERIKEENIITHEIDFDKVNISKFAKEITTKHQDISLIHVHPGKSRLIGEAIQEINKKPLIITIHGKWFNTIEKNNKKYSKIICVSEIISQIIKQQSIEGHHKIMVLENAFDESIFQPRKEERIIYFNQAVFCGRLDEDKRASIELMYKIWEEQANGKLSIFSWLITGDGSLRDEMQEKANTIFLGVPLVSFLGWKNRRELSDLYQKSLFMIGAGRAALEALACGCPVIACSNEFEASAPIYNFDSYFNVAYSNFGGFGTLHKDNASSDVINFIKNLTSDQNYFNDVYAKIANHLLKTRSSNVIAEKTINCYLDVLDENS